MSKLSAAMWGLAAGACAASAPACAENLLGFYVGGALGESTVRSDNTYLPGGFGYGFDGFYHDSTHHFAWKAIAGIRPISIVGAELEYIDFGHPGGDGGYYSSNYGPDTHPRAIAAFGVGHLPLPIPFLDIYGKAGAARLHTNVNGFDGSTCVFNQTYPQCGSITSQGTWDTRFSYGAGVQSRIWGLSVRAEYERINSQFGDPDLFSVGATWTF
jgi:outer membrane protein with beta-barrel domain